MASSSRTLRGLMASVRRPAASVGRQPQHWPQLQARGIHATAPCQTDGVFRGLTDDRLPTPWIEAFRAQQNGSATASAESQPQERDMTPRKMSDSYHRVVLPLGQDPWLSDTYINASGHIR
jgi:acyl-coenzyme A thioesterase 9